MSLRLFKSSKDKDKDDDDSPPSSGDKQATPPPPTKSTEPSPRKMGPAGDFNLEALKRVGDLLNSQPGGGDGTCRMHTLMLWHTDRSD